MEKDRLPEKPVDEKNPVLLPLALFFSYITDLVFVALVFVIFFLASKGLHHFGNALDVSSSFLFVLRFFELMVITASAFCCAFFCMKVTIDFFKEIFFA